MLSPWNILETDGDHSTIKVKNVQDTVIRTTLFNNGEGYKTRVTNVTLVEARYKTRVTNVTLNRVVRTCLGIQKMMVLEFIIWYLIVYAVLIGVITLIGLGIQRNKEKVYEHQPEIDPSTITVLIPFRNEEDRILPLIDSINTSSTQ